MRLGHYFLPCRRSAKLIAWKFISSKPRFFVEKHLFPTNPLRVSDSMDEWNVSDISYTARHRGKVESGIHVRIVDIEPHVALLQSLWRVNVPIVELNDRLGFVGKLRRRPESELFFRLAETTEQAILVLSSMESDAARWKKGRSKPDRVFRHSLALFHRIAGLRHPSACPWRDT